MRDRHPSSHLDQQQDSKTGYKLSLRKGRVRLVKSFRKDCHLTTGRGWEPGLGASSTEPMKLKTESGGGLRTHTQTHAHQPPPGISQHRTDTRAHPSPHHAATSSHQNKGPMNRKLVEKDRHVLPQGASRNPEARALRTRDVPLRAGPTARCHTCCFWPPVTL